MPRLGFACMCLLACCVNGVDHVEYAVSQNGEGKAPVIRRSLAVHWDGEVREHGQHTDHSTQESDAATGHLSSRGSKRSARGELKGPDCPTLASAKDIRVKALGWNVACMVTCAGVGCSFMFQTTISRPPLSSLPFVVWACLCAGKIDQNPRKVKS
eukprot:6470028-Amphidinium_carterae.2